MFSLITKAMMLEAFRMVSPVTSHCTPDANQSKVRLTNGHALWTNYWCFKAGLRVIIIQQCENRARDTRWRCTWRYGATGRSLAASTSDRTKGESEWTDWKYIQNLKKMM
ncbi:hypothetical protein DPMN_007645 [Dreissena polymorpha]|uniref:Uncharacterized protein n=1 Tax=Dreissena polymorpha TaxID=45954 RepID=A0A9D4MUP8_DREPO|nr:hypothetical protein DPMN_007645 [Dreissena polymorpha]